MSYVKQITYWTIGGFENEKPIRQALEDTKACGFDGLELAFGAGVFNTDVTEDDCQRILDDAAELDVHVNLTMTSGNYWAMPLSAQDETQRQKSLEFSRKYIQVAGWLGVKTILIIPGAVDVGWDPSVPVVSYRKVWDTSTKSLDELLPVAEDHGVVLGLENVWSKFLVGPMETKAFIDQFDSPYVRAYFDVGNVLISGYPEHWIEILGDRIAAVQVKNFSRQDAGGVLHGFGDDLLEGDVDWEAVKAALRAIDYCGPITAEMLPFSRLPDMVLPDMDLARDTGAKMKQIFGAP
jgi:hexulose-6-phosphate isomerase